MTILCDLHTHTTASDGQYTPGELVNMAKERGLAAIAVTDHDTVDGLEEAARAGERCGLRVIPGIELGAREYPTFHLLGYGISPQAPALQDLCRRMKDRRDQRTQRLLAFLEEKGLVLTAGEVEEFAGGEVIGRPHFAQAMVRRGYVSSNREAFDRYLDTQEYHERVGGGKPTVWECLEAIHAAGGKTSLAHPYQIGLGGDELEKLVGELAARGLDAIECHYPKHTPAQRDFYLYLAEKYRLHCTGGSDFHGERVKPDTVLASLALELDWLDGAR